MSGSQHNIGRYVRTTNDESKVNCIIDANNEILTTRVIAAGEEFFLFSEISNENKDRMKQTTDHGHTLEPNTNATKYYDGKKKNNSDNKGGRKVSKNLNKKKKNVKKMSTWDNTRNEGGDKVNDCDRKKIYVKTTTDEDQCNCVYTQTLILEQRVIGDAILPDKD